MVKFYVVMQTDPDDVAMTFTPLSVCHTPVFQVGELLVVDDVFEREQGYPGRKPSKWAVAGQTFDNVDDAIALCRSLLEPAVQELGTVACPECGTNTPDENGLIWRCLVTGPRKGPCGGSGRVTAPGTGEG